VANPELIEANLHICPPGMQVPQIEGPNPSRGCDDSITSSLLLLNQHVDFESG
jgi:hypothetical protein